MTSEAINLLARQTVDAAFCVHREIGPGLLESTYEACLLYELRKRGHHVETQVAVPVIYDSKKLVDVGYRMDMLVDSELVLEIKAQEAIAIVHKAQLLSYLKHSKRRLGLLVNFHSPLLKDGITRIVNGL